MVDLPAESSARQLSTQLNVVLAVQALTPVVLELTPNFLYALNTVYGLTSTSSTAMISGLLNWAPLVNALSIIVIVKPDRMTFLRTLRRGKVISCFSDTGVTVLPAGTSSTRNQPT